MKVAVSWCRGALPPAFLNQPLCDALCLRRAEAQGPARDRAVQGLQPGRGSASQQGLQPTGLREAALGVDPPDACFGSWRQSRSRSRTPSRSRSRR